MDFRDRRKTATIGINITSLVDVLFIILIFVLVSTTFLEQPALDIELPEAETAGLQKIKEIVISVSQDGKLYFNEKAIEKGKLKGMLVGQMKNEKEDLPVVLKADKSVNYGLVIEVMDIMRSAGVKKMVALTTPPVNPVKDLPEEMKKQ